MGALSVPPLVQISLDQTEWKSANNTDDKTPSGCTDSKQAIRDCAKGNIQVAYPNKISSVRSQVQSEVNLLGHWLEEPCWRRKQPDYCRALPSSAPSLHQPDG